MNKVKIFSIVCIATATLAQAQDLDLAKRAIDAEQYEKAKSSLKSIFQSKPNGKAAFLLGTIYLKQGIEDSAKIYFDKGLTAGDGAKFNSIGLGQLDLENGNLSAAQAKFDTALKDVKKKEVDEYIYVAKAYMNTSKPDYKAALNVLNKAKAANPNDAQVQMALGDAFYGEKNQNDAYSAYRSAYNTTDKSLIRAKMQLGVLLKGAKAYTEAVKAYDEVITLDANYGPVYRELAETHYLWANNLPRTYDENIKKALGFYEKYMSLTDYSLSSRMRHADFLILAKDYKALEIEANKMKELDKVNPRILRYLGYAAYKNNNPDAALSALNEFVNKGTNKVIARDYLYLGLAKIKKSVTADEKTVDATVVATGIADIKKSVEMEITMAGELNEIGKEYFSKKLYGIASSLFEIAISNPDSKNYLEDNVYYGLSVFTDNNRKDVVKPDLVALDKADKAMDVVITKNPEYQEAYYYKARINRLLEKDDIITANYQKYVDMIVAKGEEEVIKNKAKVIESYNNIGANYANSDKIKAKEYFNKTLALDPTNGYALDSIKSLK